MYKMWYNEVNSKGNEIWQKGEPNARRLPCSVTFSVTQSIHSSHNGKAAIKMDKTNHFLTRPELAKRWRVAPDIISRRIRQGLLPGAWDSNPVGQMRSWRIPLRVVEDFERTHAFISSRKTDGVIKELSA